MTIQLPSFLYEISRMPAVAVGLPLALGFLNGQITKTSIKTWYPTLRRPAVEPPRWAFPVAWTVLYLSMGLASHLIVKKYDAALPGSPLKHAADRALKLYWLQFALNQAWTPLFFGLHQMGLALVDIGFLTTATYALTYEAYKVDSRTAWLLVPYCGWLSFASYLNGASPSPMLLVLVRSPPRSSRIHGSREALDYGDVGLEIQKITRDGTRVSPWRVTDAGPPEERYSHVSILRGLTVGVEEAGRCLVGRTVTNEFARLDFSITGSFWYLNSFASGVKRD
ncbi:hypothetical protein JCM16303_001277 [Sporobolomyces ruberrimus]